MISPLSYVLARRDLNRPDNFTGALHAARNEVREAPHTRLVLGDFLIALAWCIGALFAAFFLLIGVQILIPNLLVADIVGPWVATAILLVVWIGLTVEGTRRTLRWVHRRWPRVS